MFVFLYAVYTRWRDGLVRDQGRPEPCELSFWSLLLSEFPILARRVGPLKVIGVVISFFGFVLAAEILLNEATPGPFLSPRWRLVVALIATLLFVSGWAVVHAIRAVRAGQTR